MADLRYKVVVDDAEAKRKLAELLKGTGVGGNAGNDGKNQVSSLDAVRAATVKLKEVQAQASKDISKAKIEEIESRVKNKEAMNAEAVAQSKLKLDSSISNAKELKEAQLANIEALRQARLEATKQKQAQSDLNQAYLQGKITAQQYALEKRKQADAEKEAARQARETKKALAENSEYSKLTKALNNIRKETKDVLAEMFKLEQQGKKNSAAYSQLEQKSKDLVKQTNLLDSGVKKIDATVGQHQRNVGNYASALDNIIPIIGRVNSQLAGFGVTLDDLAGKPSAFKELGVAVVGLGKSLIAFIATPVGAALAALGALFALFQSNKQTVIDFNSGLRNVSKTTGIVGADLDDFGDAVIALSMKLKVVDATTLLGYATVAGQLGVKGRADILAFTEALAMLETASNIKGEEGGSDIARMLTLVDGGVQNVKDFGDEVVNLGNNFAATEKEILENATQIAQNVGIYKIGRQEVLAFATATKAVGLEAELVGSTFSRTLGEFEKSIRSGKGVADLLKIIGGTSAELSKRFKDDAAGVFVDYVRGLNEINKSGGSVNEALERTGIIAVRDQRVIASLASNGFDVLTDALDKVSSAQGAMQAEFENGAGKLEQQSKRMGIAWDNFVLSIENGEGVIGRSVVAIMGFFAGLLDQINKTFNPTSIDEFVARLTSFDKADKIREINLAFDSGSKSFNSVLNTTPTNSNVNSLLKETQSAIKSTSEAYDKYKDAVNKGVLTDGGKAKLKDYEILLKNLRMKEYQLTLLGGNTSPSGTTTTFEETEAGKKKAEAAQRAAERRTEQARQAVERQRSLQGQIDALANQSTRNQLSRDEEEIASIRDKYAKMREEVRKFYADPKNKGLRVDEGKLKQAESFEVSEATTRQGTKELLKQLNEQKSIYDQYNAYVEQNGVEAAEKMFGEQSDLAKEYRSKLESEYFAIAALQKTAALSPFTGVGVKLTQAQEERAQELRKLLDSLDKEDQAKARAKYASMLQLSATNESKIADIRKKYTDAYEQLEKNKTKITEEEYEKRKEALKKGQVEEIGSILLPDLQKGGDWVNVFEKNAELARTKIAQSSDNLKTELKKMLDEGEISVDQYNDIIKQIQDVDIQISVSERGFARLRAILKELKEAEKGSIKHDQAREALGGEISKYSQGIAEAGQGLVDIADQLGIGSEKFKEDMALTMNLVSDAGALAASIASGDVVGMVVNGIKTISSAIALFTKDRKIERQIKEYQIQLEQLGKTYDDLARKMAGNDANYYTNADAQLKNLKAQEEQVKKMMQAEESKKKTDSDKVNSYKQQIKDIQQSREDLEKSIREMRLQTDINSLAQSITDALVGAFEAGEDGIEAMDKAFDKFIKNSLANSARLKFVQSIIDEMMGKVDTYMASNDNSLAGFDFSMWQERLGNAGKQVYDFLESAYAGLGLEKDGTLEGSSSSLKSEGIERISEQSATEFIGLSRAQLDIHKRQLLALQSMQTNGVNYLAIANNQLAQLNAINTNTADTVKRLDITNAKLDDVIKSLR